MPLIKTLIESNRADLAVTSIQNGNRDYIGQRFGDFQDPLLSYALKNKLDNVADALLDQNDPEINAGNQFGNTPLHCAMNNPKFVPKLIDKKADLNKKNHAGQTPLYDSIHYYKDSASATMLIKAGAEFSNDRYIDENFMRDKYRAPILIHAIRMGWDNMVQALFESDKLDVNATDTFGETALFKAVDLNNVDYVNKLAAKKAALNHKNESGNNALQGGAWFNKEAALIALVEQGADIDGTYGSKKQPLKTFALENKMRGLAAAIDNCLNRAVLFSRTGNQFSRNQAPPSDSQVPASNPVAPPNVLKL